MGTQFSRIYEVPESFLGRRENDILMGISHKFASHAHRVCKFSSGFYVGSNIPQWYFKGKLPQLIFGSRRKMFLIQIQVNVHSFLIYKRNAEETARCQNKQSYEVVFEGNQM